MPPDLREPNFYLLGFMGAGKSTVGPLLAEKLATQFYDLDLLIEDAEKATIRQIFELRGEHYFRARETELLIPLTRLHHSVVALGGGTFVQEANRALIRATGVSIWLNVPLRLIQNRIQDPFSRPLFRSPREMEALYQQRLPFYRMADIEIGITSESAEEIAGNIFDKIRDKTPLGQ
ncbi:MAG: shikimate kinase [Acidobacteria bacterium]|nr:shikimate kinase [Acidobacteriota bacterium]